MCQGLRKSGRKTGITPPHSSAYNLYLLSSSSLWPIKSQKSGHMIKYKNT